MSVTTDEYIFIAAIGLLLLWSVCSNACVIGLVLKNKKMRNPTNMLICNLALCDILFGGVILPQNLHDISHTDDYHEGAFACRVVNTIPIFLILMSIYTLVAMSYERYRAIVLSTSPKVTKSYIALVIIGIWSGSLICSVPTLLEYALYEVNLDTTEQTTVRQSQDQVNTTGDVHGQIMHSYITSPLYDDMMTTFVEPGKVADHASYMSAIVDDHDHDHVSVRCGSVGVSWLYSLLNGIFLILLAYIIPTVLIWRKYAKLISFILKFNKDQTEDSRRGENFFMFKKKVHIMKMCVVVAALFELCWLPYFTLLLYSKITGLDDSTMLDAWSHKLRIVLSTFSVSYNAVLYIKYNDHFRSGFRNLFCAGQCKKVSGNAVGPSNELSHI